MPDDISNLWDAVNDLREGQKAMLVGLGRIEAMLEERCEARVQRIDKIEAKQASQEKDLQALKEHRSFSRGQQTALTAAGTVIGSAAGAVAAHFLGGK